eukprot:TRINITY_DN1348_c0_g1_i2.p1 TRINITY_DN1348_c0_g1~~TRINITY_DN1348_c0_g1_i2.p1  ORF type:complete len:363 (+),score=138.11 TRINITY_DN1348_c0_g1_i2:120-1208(+)
MDVEEPSIQKSVLAHASYFAGLVASVPPQFYFAEEEEEPMDWKLQMQKKSKKAKKKLTKKDIAEKKLALAQKKNRKIDVMTPGFAQRLQQKRAIEEDRMEYEKKTVYGSDKRKMEFSKGKTEAEKDSVDIDTLRKRLHDKIARLQDKSKGGHGFSSDMHSKSVVSSAASGGDVTKDKEIEDLEGVEEHPAKKRKTMEPKKKEVDCDGDGDVANAQDGVDDSLSFGRIRFDIGEGPLPQGKKITKAERVKLLKRAEALQKKLEEGTEEDRKEFAARDALKRMKGEKVMSDPRLIKKRLERDQKKKVRSAKKWGERMKRRAGFQVRLLIQMFIISLQTQHVVSFSPPISSHFEPSSFDPVPTAS